MPSEIILLSRSDIESPMPFGEYVDAVSECSVCMPTGGHSGGVRAFELARDRGVGTRFQLA